MRRPTGLVADAAEPLVDNLLRFADGVQAEVGQLAALQVSPDLLDRVEVGGVSREPFDDQPFSLLLEEGLHDPAAMGRKSVPDEGDLVAVKVAAKLREELDE